MFAVAQTYQLGCAGRVVFAPCVNRFAPFVVGGRIHRFAFGDFMHTSFIEKKLVAYAANPIGYVARLCAGGGLGFFLCQGVGGKFAVFLATQAAMGFFGAGGCPAAVTITVNRAVVGYHTAFGHRNGTVVRHRTIIGQSRSIRDGQAGVFSDGQCFVRTDLQVLLQGHIAVHGAVLAVKDDTSVAIAACTNLNTRFLIVSQYSTVSCIHHCVAADGQAGSASIARARPIIVNSDITIATGGQASIIYRNSRSG